MGMESPLLPILVRRAEIEHALSSHQVVVICGETGSGKTTQLPQICLALDEQRVMGGIGGINRISRVMRPKIAHTQPRRIAARAVAARIAQERGEPVGQSVGFKVRFQDETSRETRIKLMTDGLLLAELSNDPTLADYSTIILDEAHERSLNIDFLLGYLRTLLPKRPDLKLVITSATIEPKRFSDYFGGAIKAPVLKVSGRAFPIEMRYWGADGIVGRDGPAHRDSDQINPERIADAVEELDTALPDGDTLVFLPGEREIRLAADAITRRRMGVEVLPLYSRLSNPEQDRIFQRTPNGPRRVILATNVAETSLTVPGIRSVVDTGLAKLSRYDPPSKTLRLMVESVSQASASQRAGRCGRVAAGVCIRLFSEQSYKARPVHTDPEIRRTSLAGVILQMHTLRLGAIEDFAFIDRPDVGAIADGYETLYELGAITTADRTGTLTPIGSAMSRMPLEPRIARMLLGGIEQDVLEDTVVLAAALSIQDPRERPTGRQDEAELAQSVFRDQTSDFLTLLNLWRGARAVSQDDGGSGMSGSWSGSWSSWCREHFLSIPRMREWRDLVQQLREVTDELPPRREQSDLTSITRVEHAEAIHRALLTGLICNVACRENDNTFDYRSIRGSTAQIFPGSALFKQKPKWIMAAELVQTSRLFARTVAKIDPAWIEDCAGHLFKRQFSDAHLDTATGQPRAFERVMLSSIVVVPRRAAPLVAMDAKAARRIFLLEGLAQCKWLLDAPFMHHNRATLRRAEQARDRLRHRQVLTDPESIAIWFDSRVPVHVAEPASFEGWLTGESARNPDVLCLNLDDVLALEARAAFDPGRFPDSIVLSDGTLCPVSYELAPGKEVDGVTVSVPLTTLALFKARAGWLIPGMLPEFVHALLKQLPKALRAQVERIAPKGDLETIARACADAVDFGTGDCIEAISEAMQVLYDVTIKPEEWPLRSLPDHLRLRIRVTDDAGEELASDRDVGALLKRLDARLQRARAMASASEFERHDIVEWDFENLPEPSSLIGDRCPALLDERTSVSLTLVGSPQLAIAHTRLGVRRLFALAVAEEVGYYLEALSTYRDMVKHFSALGSEADLLDQLACIVVERVFMEGQPPVRSRELFVLRLDGLRTKLSTASREVGTLVAGILEPRFLVAKRLGSGTNRLWADSIADIREHAAYLMPGNFLALVPPERLRHYPRYAMLMRERLLALREDGSKAETDALAKFKPHWKQLTAFVANAMSEQRRLAEAAGDQQANAVGAKGHAKTKAPLPQARRAAPTVNLDAGEWAMQPANLSPAMEQYRWALEDLRLAMFAPLPPKGGLSVSDIERLWKVAQG